MTPTPSYEIHTAFARRGPLRRYRLRQVADDDAADEHHAPGEGK